MQSRENELAKHRVIGIRCTLRAFKKEGLIESDILFPEEGVESMRDLVADAGLRWYKIGARRGALTVIGAILRGEVSVQKEGNRTIVETNLDAIAWPKKRIKVRVGRRKIVSDLGGFELRMIEDLGFKAEK